MKNVTASGKVLRVLVSLVDAQVGDMVADDLGAKLGAGWHGSVYICDGSHKDGTRGFKVLHVR